MHEIMDTMLYMLYMSQDFIDIDLLRPQLEVCEAHFHRGYKQCVIGAIPSQTYRNVW